VHMAQTHGIGLLLWSPLGAGVLTDRYTRENPPAHVELNAQCWAVLDALRATARAKQCTASQCALAWCLQQSELMLPIAGPRTLAQLEDNLGAVDVVLHSDDLARLDAVSPPGWTARSEWFGLQFGMPHAQRL
jgi:aryl-alcohol dehydrogenase-like predicted oxidoreductase